MNKFEKDITNLIKDSLSGMVSTYSDLDYKSIFYFALKNQMVGLLFVPLSKIADFKQSEIYKKFLDAFLVCINYSESQLHEFSVLSKLFDENQIDYVALKGIKLKNLYQVAEMRSMGDIDILIKESQMETIKKILIGQGYVFELESNHEITWNKGNLIHLELHKRLIPSYNKDYYEYYGDGWDLIKNGKLTEEDEFIYLFTHFAKHYRDAGVGIKYIVDLYVYLNYYKNIDFSYIENELKKLKLDEFYKNIIDLINVWFNGKESTEKTEFITDFIFSCGVYGKNGLHYVSDGLKVSKTKKYVKTYRFFRMLFPPYESLSVKYKILKKCPILLPVIYMIRPFEIIIYRRKNIKANFSSLKNYTKDNIEQYQRELKYVGLDYNFKE